MKKFLAFLCMTAMLFSMTACGKSGAEKTVDEFCRSMQKFDLTAMGDASMSQEDLKEQLDSADEMTSMMYTYWQESAAKMTYKITACEQKDDETEVSVKFHFMDCSDLFYTTFCEALMSVLEGESEQGDTVAYTEAFLRIFHEKVKSTDAVTMDQEAVFTCVKDEDGKWKIKKVPDAALTVLTCNMQAGVDKLNSMIDSAK